jgi:urease accessory protein
MTIITDPGRLLNLLAWLSPAFPIGAFAYSHGLEWAVEAGDLSDGYSLHRWLTDVLAHGSGRSDAILLRHAHRAAADPIALRDIVALATACAPARERRDEALNQGRAFQLAVAPWATTAPGEMALFQTGRSHTGLPQTRLPQTRLPPAGLPRPGPRIIGLPEDTPYSVALGAAAGARGITENDTAVAYLQAFATNLISAAVRLVPLGQTTGLRVLAALEPVILATAEETKTAALDDVGGCAFRSDIAAMRHETQYTRLFRS